MKLLFLFKSLLIAFALFAGFAIAGWIAGGVVGLILDYIKIPDNAILICVLLLELILLVVYSVVVYNLLKEIKRDIPTGYFWRCFLVAVLAPPALLSWAFYWILENMRFGF